MAGLGGTHGRARIPLALVVSRYFIYVLIGVLLAAGIPLATFAWQMGSGAILSANYGEVHLSDVEQALADQASFDAAIIPSAYHFALFRADGSLLASDMSDAQVDVALTVAGTSASASRQDETGLAQAFYASVEVACGGHCVLRYDLKPQWADKEMRDALPNPQDLFIWTVLVASVLVLALIALRAGRAITRRMEPLTSAAEAVGRQDLDTPVGESDVAEINDVLCAMEAMRVSLRDSLEAQQTAERQSREQIAALAHDLKTPLTVVLGNADLLAEDAATGALGPEQAASARTMRDAALTMNAFVDRIVEVSRGQVEGMSLKPVDPRSLADELEGAAERLVTARDLAFVSSRAQAFEEVCDAIAAAGSLPLWDASALERAVLNLVGNACDYAHGGEVSLSFSYDASVPAILIAVEDDGPGFSPEALAHGAERFFRGDASRTSAAGASGESHFGLGLAIAQDVAKAHDGSLELSNRGDADGNVVGARACISLPL